MILITFFRNLSYAVLFLFLIASCKKKVDAIKVDAISECAHPCSFKDSKGEHFACDYWTNQKGYIALKDSTKIWVEIEGNGSPLLLIQGGPLFDHRYFHPHFSALSDNNSIIYVDLRGRFMADESTANAYNIMQDIDDLEWIRKKLGISQWTVLGHSFGGFIAILYSIKYPSSLKAVITVSTPLGINPTKFDSVAKDIHKQYFSEVENSEQNILAQQKLNFYQTPSDYDIEYWKQALSFYNNYDKFSKLSESYFTNSENIWKQYLGNDFLHLYDTLRINTPLIAISGKQDKVGFWQDTQSFLDILNSRTDFILFDNSSHFPWIDENKKFFAILNKKLSSLNKKRKYTKTTTR